MTGNESHAQSVKHPEDLRQKKFNKIAKRLVKETITHYYECEPGVFRGWRNLMNTSGCKVPFCVESIMDLDKQQLNQRVRRGGLF